MRNDYIGLSLGEGRSPLILGKTYERFYNNIDAAEVAHLARHTAGMPEITERFYVSMDNSEATLNGVRCVSWRRFLESVFWGR